MNITVIYGSYRQARLGDRAAKLVINMLKAEGHQVTFLDAKEENLPILDKRLSDYAPGTAPENLLRIADTIKGSHALVFINGEYNHTVQPGLSNLVDHFYIEFQQKTAGIVSYSTGRIAGARSGAHLRNSLNSMGMLTIPSMLYIGEIETALDTDGNPSNPALEKQTASFIKQLIWYATAIENHKETTPLAS